MDKIKYDKNLISYTTEHKLAGHKTHVLRPKLIGYGVVMLLMIGLFITQIATVEPMGLDVLRDRNQLARISSSGLIENTYTLKIINKTQQTQQYELNVTGIDNLTWYGAQRVNVKAGEVLSLPMSLGASETELNKTITTIEFEITNSDGQVIKAESRFFKKL